MPTPDDPEDLLGVLARLAGDGQPWALDVEQWRQDNPGRILTEGQRKVLRKERDKINNAARPIVTTQDELDIQAIVAAYVEAQRRVLRDKAFVALDTHHRDAKAILGDTRRLAERAKRGEWRPTPAEVVAHKCRAYMANPRNVPFALRFLLDRTEQDDLPVPPKPKPQKRGPDPPPAPPPPEAFDIAKGNLPPLSAEEQKDLDELKGRLKR